MTSKGVVCCISPEHGMFPDHILGVLSNGACSESVWRAATIVRYTLPWGYIKSLSFHAFPNESTVRKQPCTWISRSTAKISNHVVWWNLYASICQKGNLAMSRWQRRECCPARKKTLKRGQHTTYRKDIRWPPSVVHHPLAVVVHQSCRRLSYRFTFYHMQKKIKSW